MYSIALLFIAKSRQDLTQSPINPKWRSMEKDTQRLKALESSA